MNRRKNIMFGLFGKSSYNVSLPNITKSRSLKTHHSLNIVSQMWTNKADSLIHWSIVKKQAFKVPSWQINQFPIINIRRCFTTVYTVYNRWKQGRIFNFTTNIVIQFILFTLHTCYRQIIKYRHSVRCLHVFGKVRNELSKSNHYSLCHFINAYVSLGNEWHQSSSNIVSS